MKFILALTTLATVLMTAAKADSIATCSVPPVPPVGCSNEHATCVCDAAGNCRWVYDCTQRQ